MKRPGDDRPPPPGGRAAERLREFEAARADPVKKQKSDKEDEQPDNPEECKESGSE